MKDKQAFIVVITLLFLQGIFMNIHHPITPSYVAELNFPDYMFGFFFAFMSLGAMVSAPLWGSLADHGKKKISVFIGFLIYGLAQYLFGLGEVFGPWGLAIVRFFSGVGMAAPSTIFLSEVVVISKKHNKTRNLVYGAAATAIGGAIGQYFGGFIYTNDFFIKYFKTDHMPNVLIIQGLLSAFLALLVLVMFKPKEVVNNQKEKGVNIFKAFKLLKTKDIKLIIFLISFFFFSMSHINIDKYLDVYFINDLGYKEDVLGQFKMIVGFVGVFTSILMVPLLKKIKAKLQVIAIFQLLSAVLVLICFRGTMFSFLVYLYTYYLVYIIIKTVNLPVEREYVASFAEEENMGRIMGIRQSFLSLSNIIGPILGAFLYHNNRLLVFDFAVLFFIIGFLLIMVNIIIMKKEEKIITED